MPEREDDLKPTTDLALFADQLKLLAPQPVHLSRDALLFSAGKAAAASKVAPWVWPSLTGLFASVSIVMGGFLLTPNTTPLVQYVDRERIVYVERSEAKPVEVATQPPAPPPPHTATPEATPSLAEHLRLRRDVMRWGVEMLPQSTASAKPTDVNVRELSQWLSVPPGTFTIHRQPPQKMPKKTEEDDE